MLRYAGGYHTRKGGNKWKERLANIDGEVRFDLPAPVTQRAVLDALEARYPALLGTTRDRHTKRRRAYIRFFACNEDWSDAAPDDPLPEAVAWGQERKLRPYGLSVGGLAFLGVG